MKLNSEKKLKEVLQKIKKERIKLGWSQYEIGVKLHISQNAYYKLETGKTKLDLQRFIEITNLLEIKPEKFLQ